MTPRLIYIVGQPGSGKTTLMARLTEGYDLLDRPGLEVPHLGLIDRTTGEIVGAEIGKRRGTFSGTDALASSIIDRAAPWVKTQPYPLLLAEGARLGNRRFVDAALEGGYQVVLVLLDHPKAEEWRTKRAVEIGKDQNHSWVMGRRTASRNLADALTGPAYTGKNVVVFRGSPDALYQHVAPLLSVNG